MSAAVRFRLSTLACLLISACLLRPAHAAPLEGVHLRDQRGTVLTQARLDRQVVLLNFVFTQCATTCPVQVRELAAVHDALPPQVREKVRFVSVSVDPLSDTPATLAAFARRMGAERAGWTFATGAPSEVGRLVERLQAQDRSRDRPGPADHRTALYLFDARGDLIQRHAGMPVDRQRLVTEISRLTRLASAH